MSIGRRPDTEVFLDDVTVSRDHALLIGRGDHWHLDDCGSLNGTYVNRERIESQRLEEGDEVQIGKYKLTLPRTLMATEAQPDPAARRGRVAPRPSGQSDGTGGGRQSRTRSAPCARRWRRSSRTSRSPRSAIWRIRSCSTRGAPRAAIASTPGRRGAAAHDFADATRRVPAAAGDPPGARRRARGAPAPDRR